MITLSINVMKIDKSKLFEGKNGAKYLNCVLFEVQDDKFGNDYRVVQSLSKEERAAGRKGAILGSGKNLNAFGNKTTPKPESMGDDDQINF